MKQKILYIVVAAIATFAIIMAFGTDLLTPFKFLWKYKLQTLLFTTAIIGTYFGIKITYRSFNIDDDSKRSFFGIAWAIGIVLVIIAIIGESYFSKNTSTGALISLLLLISYTLLRLSFGDDSGTRFVGVCIMFFTLFFSYQFMTVNILEDYKTSTEITRYDIAIKNDYQQVLGKTFYGKNARSFSPSRSYNDELVFLVTKNGLEREFTRYQQPRLINGYRDREVSRSAYSLNWLLLIPISAFLVLGMYQVHMPNTYREKMFSKINGID